MTMSFIKRQILRILTARPVAAPFAPLTVGHATIFMMHRFRHPDRGVEGDDPAVLRDILAYLRKERYELLPLRTLFDRLQSGAPSLRRTVAFTIDDGYADHAEIAAPAFAHFDCPVTTFVTSGFLDGDLWFWWDRIEYAFQQSARKELHCTVDGTDVSYSWESEPARRRAQEDFTARCKRVPDADKLKAIARIASQLEVEIPQSAPSKYAAMSWHQLRACESSGVTFGPHTVTHPVLSRATDDQSRRELTESWRRLTEEAAEPVPIFCYPNGQEDDFGEREIRTLKEMGMSGAVVGIPGHASVRHFQGHPDARFRVRRIAYPGDRPLVVQYASGLEILKQTLRRETAVHPC